MAAPRGQSRAACTGPRGCGREIRPLCSATGGTKRRDSMMTCARLLAAVAAVAALFATPVVPPAEAAGIGLTPHRAVYDLKLLHSRGRRSIEAVRGRILYDFSGSVCAGYVLNFRQVSELDTGEGKVALSDLRATTWEEGGAKSFRFNSQNFIDQRAADTVDGEAAREADHVVVKLAKPKDKSFDLEPAMVFPTEHMRRIIEAARVGKNILELPVYDGSETGERIYSTLTVIGHEIAPGEKNPTDAAGGQAALAGLKRWPVTVSYFERTEKTS